MVFSVADIEARGKIFQIVLLSFKGSLKSFDLLVIHVLLQVLKLILVFLDQRLLLLLFVKNSTSISEHIGFEVLLLLKFIDVLDFELLAEVFKSFGLNILELILQLFHFFIEGV